MRKWIKHEEITDGGDVGGDYQVTDAWSARWSLDGDPQRIITVYTYGEVGPDDHDTYDDGKMPDRLFITAQAEYLICTDPADPGGTEVFSDARYFSPLPESIAADEADRFAKAWITGLAADGSFARIFSWDGDRQVPNSDEAI